MGAWGYRTFENDTAMDWLGDLAASEGVGFLEQTLLGKDDVEGACPDADEAAELLAAAEIVSGFLNGPRAGLPDEAAAWIQANRRTDAAVLKPVCERQLGRVMAEGCELHQLWQENKELYPTWKAHVQELQRALTD